MKRLIVSLLCLAAPAFAQPIDLSKGGPVDVTAAGGFEWHDQEQQVIAYGDARAVRQDATVLADRLIAHYRKRAGAPTTAATTGSTGGSDQGGNEIYRLEATGHVRIVTATDEAVGDHAIYDIDQAVLVMTGGTLRLTTPQQVVTARDSLEYWSDKHMAVARGAAVVITSDGKRVSADTLVAYTQTEKAPATKPQPAKPQPATAKTDPATSGKLERVEAFGNVELRTAADIVRGERAVYVQDTGMARILGAVRITHGQSQINGPAADVNMRTGVAHMIAPPGGRVQGMIVPNDAQNSAKDTGVKDTGAKDPGPKPAPAKPGAKKP
jgi:lipopolysaccharide export system protein LptA